MFQPRPWVHSILCVLLNTLDGFNHFACCLDQIIDCKSALFPKRVNCRLCPKRGNVERQFLQEWGNVLRWNSSDFRNPAKLPAKVTPLGLSDLGHHALTASIFTTLAGGGVMMSRNRPAHSRSASFFSAR